MTDKWISGWINNKHHYDSKEKIFKKISSYTGPIKTMLDIGCGLARESEHYYKTYGTKIYLLDGDFNETTERPRDTNYGNVNNFKFYSKIDDLKKSYDERNMEYVFVDASNIQLDTSVKFDLIYSAVSCGFHYPASTYKNLIQEHIHDNTKIIFDIRKKSDQSDIIIKNILDETKKYITAEIVFKDEI